MGCYQSSSGAAANSPSFEQKKNGTEESFEIWEYLEDISSMNWVSYDKSISRQINIAYNSSARKCQISNQTNGESFEIDFNLMIETNVVNGWQRKVRINKKGIKGSNLSQKQQQVPQKSMSSQFANSNDVNPNPLLLQQETEDDHRKEYKTRFKWQWFSESIGWKDYDHKLSNKIDEAYTQNIARYAFKIRSNNTKYEIDFDRMKQCNLDTMKLRVIRRVPRSAVPSPPSPPIDDIERFIWEYYNDDDGEWHEYGDNVSLKIETVHHSNAAVARMKIHGTEYEIRLNEMPMNQYNLKTGKISPIKRMIKSAHIKRESNIRNSIDIIPQINNCKYQWRYKHAQNVWNNYPSDINHKIEGAFRSELDRYSFTMNNEQFEIQFNFLRQINLATNETNEIARIDNTIQKRAHTLLIKRHHHEPAKSMNPIHEDLNKKKRHNKRSATLDMNRNNNNPNDFDFLIKQQQKAMKYFKSQHQKELSDAFKWQFKDDNGVWYDYSRSLSLQIEDAFQNGEHSIDITKNGIVFEIRIQHNLECHFATNKMRAIKRVKTNDNIDLEDQFDALSNKLDQFVDAKEELSDYDEHDDDEKDDIQDKITPQHEEESYDEQETDDDSPQAAEAETPADSEFALKDYGNDYNDYIEKFNNLNQGYFE